MISMTTCKESVSLTDQLREAGVVRIIPSGITLKSGAHSKVYLDMRRTMSHPKLLRRIASEMAHIAQSLDFDLVCGVPLGALSLATLVSQQTDMPMIMTRKMVKAHGLNKRIEGIWTAGQRVLVIEDVITTGGSLTEVFTVLREAGLEPVRAIVVADRRADQGTISDVPVSSVLSTEELDTLMPTEPEPELMTPQIWVSVSDMPHRKAQKWCTYHTIDYSDIPCLSEEQMALFSKYKTYQDVADGKKDLRAVLASSPTACDIMLDSDSGMIYIDSQGCVAWHVNDDGTVGTRQNSLAHVVSHSVPEFLTRIHLENQIWDCAHMSTACSVDEHMAKYLTDMATLAQ